MFYYKLLLSYKGTHFYGWQKQPHQKTIQGELERALKQRFDLAFCQSLASGRTDAGVHAKGQVVKLTIDKNLPESALVRGLQGELDQDICIIDAQLSNNDFHPIQDACKKTYQYYLALERPSVFEAPFIYWPRREMNVEKLQKYAQLFIGRHDFARFMCQGTPVKSTIREIYQSQLEIIEQDDKASFLPSCRKVVFTVSGNGFLKQMVRLMVGALIKAQFDQLTESEILLALKGEGDGHLAAVAPSCGLFLSSVEYHNN